MVRSQTIPGWTLVAIAGLCLVVIVGTVAWVHVESTKGDGPVVGGFFGANNKSAAVSWPVSGVNGHGTVASTQPLLKVPGKADAYAVEIYDPAKSAVGTPESPGRPVVTGQTAPSGVFDVPADKSLTPGRTYQWRAKPTGQDKWLGPWTFAVTAGSLAGGPTSQFGALAVSEVSGVVSAGWGSTGFGSGAGPTNISVTFNSGIVAVKGTRDPWLPMGWTLSSSALPYRGIEFSTDADNMSKNDKTMGWPKSVSLTGSNGQVEAYVLNEPTASYSIPKSEGSTPVVGAASSLHRIDNSNWEFTATSGATMTFRGGKLTEISRFGAPVSKVSWEADRPTVLVDGAGRKLSLGYGKNCLSGGGLTSNVSGLLCAVTYPDNSQTRFGYEDVTTVEGPKVQLAETQDPGKIITTYRYNQTGQLTGVVDSLANQLTAWKSEFSKARNELTTEIAYRPSGAVDSITAPAGTIGGPRLRTRFEHPAINQAKVLAGDLVGASVQQFVVSQGREEPVPSKLGLGRISQSKLNAATWQVSERTGVDKRTAHVSLPTTVGGAITMVDAQGFKHEENANADGAISSQAGPYRQSLSSAPQSTFEYDSDSASKKWRGPQAVVFSGPRASGDSGKQQWWDTSGLSGTWSKSPGGDPGQWSAQILGTYVIPGELNGAPKRWTFEPTTGVGTKVSLTVDGQLCDLPDNSPDRKCSFELAPGGHTVAVELNSTTGGTASYRVAAGPNKEELKDVGNSDISPGYNLQTSSTFNDVFPGHRQTQSRSTISKPWTGSPDSITSDAGRTEMTYEPQDAKQYRYGRQTSVSNPSGARTQSDYYGREDAAVFDPCTRDRVNQFGLPKSTTAIDGTATEIVHDFQGRTSAQIVKSAEGRPLQRTCIRYASDGQIDSVESFDQIAADGTGGRVVEASKTERSVGSDPRVNRVTYTLGPGAINGSGLSASTTTTTDANGRPIALVGLHGETTEATYDQYGQVVRVTVTIKGSSTPIKDVRYLYDNAAGRLVAVTLGGPSPKELARISYNGAGQQTAITYGADGSRLEYAYNDQGVVKSQTLTVATTGDKFVDELGTNSMGRTLSRKTAHQRAGKKLTDINWAYTYNPKGALTDATARSTGADLSPVGGKPTQTFKYGYDGKAGRDLNRTSGTVGSTAYTNTMNDLGRITATTHPSLGETNNPAEFGYDSLGNVTSVSGKTPQQYTWRGGTILASVKTTNAQSTDVSEYTRMGGANYQQRVTSTPKTGEPTRATSNYLSLGVVTDEKGQPTQIPVGLPGGVTTYIDASQKVLTTDHTDLTGATIASVTSGVPAAIATRTDPYGQPLTTTTNPTPTQPLYRWGQSVGNQSLPQHNNIVLNGARVLQPALGQFYSPDPSIGASTSVYGYGNGDPIDMPDPSGNFTEETWAAWGTGAAALILGVVSGAIGLKSSTLTANRWRQGLNVAGALSAAASLGCSIAGQVQGNGMHPTAWVATGVGAIAGGAAAAYGARVAAKRAAADLVWINEHNILDKMSDSILYKGDERFVPKGTGSSSISSSSDDFSKPLGQHYLDNNVKKMMNEARDLEWQKLQELDESIQEINQSQLEAELNISASSLREQANQIGLVDFLKKVDDLPKNINPQSSNIFGL